MTYSDFRKTYKWTLKQYPDTSEVYGMEDLGECVSTRQRKVGCKWVTDNVDTENMTYEFYMNMIDAIPFFRGLNGREIVTKSYTVRGYIPTQIISVSPDKSERIIYDFDFTYERN